MTGLMQRPEPLAAAYCLLALVSRHVVRVQDYSHRPRSRFCIYYKHSFVFMNCLYVITYALTRKMYSNQIKFIINYYVAAL